MNALLGPVLLAASAVAAPAAPPFARLYEINQMEMAGGLELSPNGRFRFGFDYGAVSEISEGKWTSDKDGVVLTTDPMPPSAECDRGFAMACFKGTRLPVVDGELLLFRWDARI